MITVKCLNQCQMEYIMSNYQKEKAKTMAAILGIETFKVTLFCQANGIEPVPARKHPKRFDTFLPPRGAWCDHKINLGKLRYR